MTYKVGSTPGFDMRVDENQEHTVKYEPVTQL